MKTSLKIAVLTFLVIAPSSRSYACMMITDVPSEQAAKDFGATIRTMRVGTNQVGVWLEFAPKGKLQTFSSVELEIGSDDQRLVAATLSPSKRTPDTVVVYFSTDPTHLSKSTLTVFYRISGGYPPYDGIRFKVSDWIKPPDDALNVLQGLAFLEAKLEDVGGAVAIRTFPLRHRLASQMADDLQQILPGKPSDEVKSSADNQELLVTAPPMVMTRVQTFITVNDWPDAITRGSDFQDRNNSVTRAARSFFYACAIEDSVEVFSKQLSLGVLTELKGDTKSKEFLNYQGGGKPGIDWEKSLRADWPGRKEAIERLIREWNRYPLKRLSEDPGVAIGFGVKHFCSVFFEGAPKPFYQITIEPDRTKQSHDGEISFLFSSLPPWWGGDSVKSSNSKPEK